ncbi:MAG: metallophosphoesterase family protein [Thermoanaerobaculales bacterium]|nr:metallophosphoesterase family protein [Thermoanaerobaculales bacterium]
MVIAHRPGLGALARSSTFALTLSVVLLWPGLSAAQSLVRGPYLQTPTADGVIVRWRTDVPSDTRLAYGPSFGQLGSVITDPQLVVDHEVEIVGLEPATRTYYSIGSSAAVLAGADPEHWFTTAPVGNDRSFTQIWAIGDSGTADANSAAVRDGYLIASGGVPSDVWLMLGDNAYPDGTDPEYQAAVFDTYPTILRSTPLWPAFGNHDAHSATSATQSGPYFEIFSLPVAGQAVGLASGTEAYYSFDHGNIHFVCLDTSDSSLDPGDEMLQWMVADLRATTRDWIIAFFHHPPYTKGSHDSDVEPNLIAVRENVIPLLEELGVDLVLSGHSHHYERSFLLDGHYGLSSTFDPTTMALDGGDGRPEGDGPYVKQPGPHNGAVYVVNGTGGEVGGAGAGLDHPAMFISHAKLGSMILQATGDTLDVRFVNKLGVRKDWFTLVKQGLPIFRDGFEYASTASWSGVEPGG